MAIPYRDWNRFRIATLRAQWTGAPDSADEFTTVHYANARVGQGYITGTKPYYSSYVIGRGHEDDDFQQRTGLTVGMKARLGFQVIGIQDTSSPSMVDCDLVHAILDDPASPNTWHKDKVSGRYYDGVNQWDDYYPNFQLNGGDYIEVPIADVPKSYEFVFCAFRAGADAFFNSYTEEFFRNGFFLYAGNYNPIMPNANGEHYYIGLDFHYLKVYFFEPVVNSFSAYCMEPAGGDEIILTGLGFNNLDSEISAGGASPANWTDAVDEIYFEGLQGQGTTTLKFTDGDFTIESNSQITIPSMPALALGTYNVRLMKLTVAQNVGNVSAYAGDWACAADGRCHESSRISFLVVTDKKDCYKKGPAINLTKWTFKNKDGDTAIRYYSYTDIRTPLTLYDGRLTGFSTLKREIDDKVGLFNVSDINAIVANTDNAISILMADYFMKNQFVEFFNVFDGEPSGWKESIAKMIVEDYEQVGTTWLFKMKDITKKYMKRRVPIYRCLEEDFPNIHKEIINRSMPDVVGLNTLTTGEQKGATEALLIDTTTYKYLAARGSLKSIDQVYSANELISSSDYTITWENWPGQFNGVTYITFDNDQEENKITYNAKGYMFYPWNASAGYVRNPAYVIAFFLAFIMEIPVQLLDLDSFDDLATVFENLGWEDTGRYYIQDPKDPMAELARLLYTYGVKLFPDYYGRLSAARKDISNYTTSIILFDQIDLLKPAKRKYNLHDAVNKVEAKYDFYPSASYFKSSEKDTRQKSIEDFETEIEPSQAWEFPWTDSQSMVQQRLLDELFKFGYGDQKLEFEIPLSWINDIDIFTNFRFQDPYGLSRTGAGETGRYYYVESIDYDFQAQKMKITAIDLQWLLRQYFILGDEDDLAVNWSTANESERMFGYLCDEYEDKFADGEPGKKLVDENILESY